MGVQRSQSVDFRNLAVLDPNSVFDRIGLPQRKIVVVDFQVTFGNHRGDFGDGSFDVSVAVAVQVERELPPLVLAEML